MRSIAAASPRVKARITGIFYLLTILCGLFAQGFVSGRLVADANASTTASNILNHQILFQWGFGIYLVEMACNVVITALFYDLLKPVNKSLSLVAAFLSLVGCAIKTMSRLFFFAPLLILRGEHYLNVFSTDQLQAIALLFLRVNDQGAAIALVFFGFYTPLKNYLILKSNFLPRVLGVLGMVGGVGWLSFLYAPLAYRIFPYIAILGLIGAGAQIFWLLMFGVDEEKWKAQNSAATEAISL